MNKLASKFNAQKWYTKLLHIINLAAAVFGIIDFTINHSANLIAEYEVKNIVIQKNLLIETVPHATYGPNLDGLPIAPYKSKRTTQLLFLTIKNQSQNEITNIAVTIPHVLRVFNITANKEGLNPEIVDSVTYNYNSDTAILQLTNIPNLQATNTINLYVLADYIELSKPHIVSAQGNARLLKLEPVFGIARIILTYYAIIGILITILSVIICYKAEDK